MDAEALLPLFLYFTPNLESLDLGNVSAKIIYDSRGYTLKHLNEIYNSCVGTSYEWDPENPHEIGGQLSTSSKPPESPL